MTRYTELLAQHDRATTLPMTDHEKDAKEAILAASDIEEAPPLWALEVMADYDRRHDALFKAAEPLARAAEEELERTIKLGAPKLKADEPGGKRQIGRPALGDGRRRALSVSLSPEALFALAREDNKSELIDRLVRKWADEKKE